MKMLSMEGFRIRRPSVAGEGVKGDMEGLRIKRPSVAGDRDMCSIDTGRRKEKRRKKLLEELRVVDTGSSKEKGRKRKPPPPPMEPFLSHELTAYMLYESARRPLELDPDFEVDRHFPDPGLAAKVIASLKKSTESWADMFRQFRLNGYATVSPELTGDNEKEELFDFFGADELVVVEGMTVDARSTKEEHAEVARWRRKEKKRKHDVELKDDTQALVRGKRRNNGKERDPKLDNEVKEEQAEVGKRRKKEKRRQRADKVKEEEQAEVRKRKKERHGGRQMEEVGVGSNSGKKRRTKVLRWRVSRKLLKFLHTREVMGHFAAETPPVILGAGKAFFGKRLRDEIATEFEENKEFDSYLLFQYRTKGYTEIPEVVAYNEGESEDILYFETDVENEDEYRGVSVFQ